MEDDLKKNGRQIPQKMEDNLKKKRQPNTTGRRPNKSNFFKWKTISKIIKNGRRLQAQLKKSTLIGC